MKPDLPGFENCSGCGVCSNVCGQSAIQIKLNKNGFLQPVINELKCIACGACEKTCPCLSENGLPVRNMREAIPYAAWSNNDEIRFRSSSGGAFAQIALELLQKNSTVVIGASLQSGNMVKHVVVNNVNDIAKLQGTKYIQSETEDVFRKTVNYLKSGYTVLFSGTPCQIAGIYKYVEKKEYKGELYTAEVICHGVPSKLLLEYALKKHKAAEVVSFRTKSEGWNLSQRMIYLNKNKTVCEIKSNEKQSDWFYRFFFSDLFLRPGCYSCLYGKLPRTADISLADFWGVKSFAEEQYKGISLLIANSDKGHYLIDNTKQLTKNSIHWNECLPYNRHVFFSKNELKSKSFSLYTHLIVKLPKILNWWLFLFRKNPLLWLYLRNAKKAMAKRKNRLLKTILETID
jgi:coenzyme F420-reducing hydrogenase beta subunit